MKTKAIFALFLSLLLCFGANLSKATPAACLCPAELVASSEVQTTISNALKDLCSDCGHTTNCHFSHTDIPFTGSLTLNQIDAPATLAVVPAATLFIPSVCSAVLAQSGTNKAPPRFNSSTLVSLHQQLLI